MGRDWGGIWQPCGAGDNFPVGVGQHGMVPAVFHQAQVSSKHCSALGRGEGPVFPCSCLNNKVHIPPVLEDNPSH